jgi:membrane protein
MFVPLSDKPPTRPSRAQRLKLRFFRTGRLARQAIWRGLVEFTRSENMTFAASIAYYSLLSIFPFSLLVLAALGQVTVGENGASLLQLMSRALPAQVEFLEVQIATLSERALQLGAAGTVLMLWGSMGVFGALTSAVNHAWGVEQPPGFFKHKLIAFVMLVAAGFLMVLALLLVSAAQVLETRWFAGLVSEFGWLEWLRGFVVRNAPMPLFVMVVALVYYYAPNAKVRMRDVWLGALMAGLLWRLAFWLFSWYLGDLSRFTNLHGSIAAVIAFLLWIYVSAVVLLYGAEVSAAYARLRKALPQTEPAAPPRQ